MSTEQNYLSHFATMGGDYHRVTVEPLVGSVTSVHGRFYEIGQIG